MSTPHLFFDLDGTLTLPARGIVNCIRHAVAAMGAPAPTGDLARFVGPPLQETFATLLATDDAETVDRAVAAYRDRFGTVGYLENEIVPGIEAVLDAVSPGQTCYVVTSKPALYANPILAHFGLRHHFHAVHGAEMDGTRAKKTDLIAHVLATHSINASDATMVGDRRHDIEGARANGLRTVGVTWGYGSPDELCTAEADTVCNTLSALIAALST